MQKKEIITTVYEYDSIDELNSDDNLLIEKAKEAALGSYSPYSSFKVGAAVLLDNNEIIQGNNQENAAYPSGLCAERVAIFYANSKYPKNKVITIAITAIKGNKIIDDPIPPCGSCRQVLLETELRYKSPIKVILYGSHKIQILDNIKGLLPLEFNSKNLAK